MSQLIRFENTAMFYRFEPDSSRELFVDQRGWIPIADVQVGDRVSRHTDPPRYQTVQAIETEAP
jgi:hypothetical protein